MRDEERSKSWIDEAEERIKRVYVCVIVITFAPPIWYIIYILQSPSLYSKLHSFSISATDSTNSSFNCDVVLSLKKNTVDYYLNIHTAWASLYYRHDRIWSEGAAPFGLQPQWQDISLPINLTPTLPNWAAADLLYHELYDSGGWLEFDFKLEGIFVSRDGRVGVLLQVRCTKFMAAFSSHSAAIQLIIHPPFECDARISL